jgi:hypothetical protein
MKSSKNNWSDIAVISLLIANIFPLWAVVFLGWDAFAIVLLYWAENIIIGFYNILRMALARVPHPAAHLAKLFMIPFFMVHYGGFMAVHGVFVLLFFSKTEPSFPRSHGQAWPCFFVFLQLLLGVIGQAWSLLPPNAKPILLTLFASHGVSFVYNFLIKGEYATTKPGQLMAKPYSRVVVMHIAIIAGGFFTMAMGSPIPVLVALVVLKTTLDVQFHMREHRSKSKRQNQSEES